MTKNKIKSLFSQQMIDEVKNFIVNNFSTLMSEQRIKIITKCLDFRFSTIKNLLK